MNSLVNFDAVRQPDLPPCGNFRVTKAGLAAGTNTSAVNDNVVGLKDGMVVAAGEADTMFKVLFVYIPTEVIAMYVAVVATCSSPNSIADNRILFFIFLTSAACAFALAEFPLISPDFNSAGLPILMMLGISMVLALLAPPYQRPLETSRR